MTFDTNKTYCQYHLLCSHKECNRTLTEDIKQQALVAGSKVKVYSYESFPECFDAFFTKGLKENGKSDKVI